MNMVDYSIEERELPYSLEAEQALLGAALQVNAVMEKVVGFLLPEDFVNPAHADIYRECKKQFEAGKNFNPVTLYDKFRDHEGLKEVGRHLYLNKLMSSVPSILSASDYGKLVKEHAIRRKMILLGEQLVNNAYNINEGSSKEILETFESDLYALYGKEARDEALRHISTANIEAIEEIQNAMDHKGEIVGIPSGLKGLDVATGGFSSGQLIIIAARPGMGKTAFSLNIAKGAAKAGKNVAFFSIEMEGRELSMRMASDLMYNSQNTLSYFDAKGGRLDPSQWERFKQGIGYADKLPIYLTDRGGTSPSSVRLELTRLRRKLAADNKTLDLVIIDYLQLMKIPDFRGNKNTEVSEITAALKRMAKEFKVPILLLSQLNRGLEGREDKRPMLADLRDSGAIEQDADSVMFLYREYYYIKDREPKDHSKIEYWQNQCERLKNTFEVIIAKQRHGPTCTKIFNCYLQANAIRDGLHNIQNEVF